MNNSLLSKIFLAICIVLLTSCNAYPLQSTPTQHHSPTPTESGISYDWKANWLNGSTCQPPCWEGITPGQTTMKEAKEIIKGLPGAKITSSLKNSVQWEVDKSYYSYASDQGGDTVFFIGIHFYSDQNIDLEEAINVFGKPANVQTFNCMHSICNVNVIYPEVGLALLLESLPTGDTVMIEKSSEVIGVSFFTPGIDNYSKIAAFQGLAVKKWEGYGIYQE